MSQSVSELLVSTLEQIGVKHIFGLIGDSLNPLADAVRHSKIEWVGVRHEDGTGGMTDCHWRGGGWSPKPKLPVGRP